MNPRPRSLSVPIATLLLITLAAPALADVRDGAGFFSEDAVRQANFDLRQIKQRHGKDLLVETFATVPANLRSQLNQLGEDAFYEQWTRQRAQQAKIDGVAVLITREPSHLHVAVGNKTQERAFTLADRDKLRDALLTSFGEKNYDQGLLAAVKMFRETLASNLGTSSSAAPAPVERETSASGGESAARPQPNPGAFEPAPRGEARGTGGGISFWTLLIWGIVILIVIRVIGRLLSRRGPQQGGMFNRGGGYDRRMGDGGAYDRPGLGGGGFGTGLGGGLLGGLLGGWLGGRMFGHGSEAHGAPPPTPAAGAQEPGVFADGHDSHFAGTGGSFSDGGGGDFSGGGGDVGGGGDFGGGGDSGGGGDF